MPTPSEYNQFRRLIGDFGKNEVTTAELDAYLNDAVSELTADFITPVTDFTVLVAQYRPEVVVWAAINWWWNKAGADANKHTQTVGATSQQSSEKFERDLQMIQQLRSQYDTMQLLGVDIGQGNLSRFSKVSLNRVGGFREETIRDA